MDEQKSSFPELEKAWKEKKKELAGAEMPANAGNQQGFPGFKGKDSINPKKLQSQRAEKEVLQNLNLKIHHRLRNASFLKKRDERLSQLSFQLNDENNYNRKARKGIERKLKKDKRVCWVAYSDLKAVIEGLRDNKKPLSQRSKKVYEWIHGLKSNKFHPGCVAIRPAEFKALISGFNRHQCTELFICYLSICLMAQSKSKFIFKAKRNFISHFGFNNSYSAMGWAFKQFEFMENITKRLKALKTVWLTDIKRKYHKSGKIFYQLVFKSLNIWSKALTKEQKSKALYLVKKFYLHKGLDPPDPVFLLGLDFRA